MTELTFEITKEIEQKLAPLKRGFARLVQKFGNPAQASFALGCKLVQQGKYKEALYRFKFTLWRQPRRADAWYNSAICHFALNEIGLGVAALKESLKLKPKNESALYLLATLQGGKYAEGYQPHTTPPELIKGEFSARAENYEVEELAAQDYTGHFSVYETLAEQQDAYETILDAGCGTGLMGDLLRPMAHKLIGIDLSKEMLAQARKRKTRRGKRIYDQLLEGDLRAHLLNQQKPVYHAIAAANVAPMMGGLAPMVDGAARALHSGGYLAFTALPLDTAEGYHLLSNQPRFAHSEHYLRQIAERSGLMLKSLTLKPLYGERKAWVVLMQKP
jgi:predicted TPR repeat methyltransferase